MSNRIRNFPTALKQFQSADPWAAPGFGTLCPGCMTRTTTSCGRTTEQRAKLATSKAGGDWELGWIQLRATKKKCRGRKSGPETSHGTNAGLALVLVLELPALRLLWLQFMEKRMRRMDQG